MQIDPKITFWFGVWTNILMLIGGVTIKFAGLLSDPIAFRVTGWCLLAATINSVILTALTGYSSNAKGPLVNPPVIPPTAKGAAMLALFVTVGLLGLMTLEPARAMAQTPQAMHVPMKPKRVHVADASTGGPVKVAANTAVPAPSSSAPAPGQLSATQVQQNPILLLQKFTASDLNAALADANTQTPPDAPAVACYTALLTVVNNPINNPLPSQLGLFLALQKARDAKAFLANLQSPTGPLSALNVACAPLVMDANATLLALGVTTGLVVGTGGIAIPALPGLAGLLAILPK